MLGVGTGEEGCDVNLGTDLAFDLGHRLVALVFLFANQGVVIPLSLQSIKLLLAWRPLWTC